MQFIIPLITFVFQANFEQICMHALMTFFEKLVLMRSVVLDL